MRKHITWALALGVMLMAPVAAAQTAQQPTPQAGPGQRLHIGPRIRDGVRSGQLVRPELQRLRQRLNQIRAHARTMRGSGGQLEPGERRELRREWRQASRALFLMKHNRFRRGGR